MGKNGKSSLNTELNAEASVVRHLQQWRNQMISKTLTAALLTTALMTGMASAQTTTTTKADSATTSTTHKDGEWRASKLVGVNVYNEANEKIGDISDVILDKTGKVANVVLGVGGFLGMGEHYVAVAFDKLKWVNEPVRTTVSTSTAPANAPATTAADGTARTTTGAATSSRSANENWYPDHVVINATKDQLKAMPQFKY
jgi:sporulation protein YlmC with PRC-barrel domain